MKLLITGGAGFIGSNLVTYLVKKYPDWNISVIDNFSHGGEPANLSLEDRMMALLAEEGDYYQIKMRGLQDRSFDRDWWFCLGDVRTVLTKETKWDKDFDVVLHLAALTHVDLSIHQPREFTDNNCLGTQAVLDFCVKYDKPIIYYSTDEVYGSAGRFNRFSEDARLFPRNPYSVSKAFGDMLVRAYHNTYGLKYIIVRPANCYGPRQHQEKFIPTIIRSVLDGEPVPVYGDGGQERMWVYVEDHCEAIDLLLHKGEWNQVYNIGTDTLLKNGEVARMVAARVAECTGKGYTIKAVADRPGHDRKYHITWDKIREAVGWEPKTAFEYGIRQTVDWYLEKWKK